MSDPFTAVGTWSSLQDRTHANEIVLAYSERRQVRGASVIAPLAGGDNAQDTEFWRGMQEWIDWSVGGWVDYMSGPFTLYEKPPWPAEYILLYWTLATFRAAAGLHPDGWRRSTNGMDFSYGTIQSGDIRGPWIFEDLQKALSVLRWTAGETAWVDGESRAGEDYRWIHNLDADWAELIAAVEAEYDASSGPAGLGAWTYGIQDLLPEGCLAYARMARAQGKPRITAPSDFPHVFSAYINGRTIWASTEIYDGHGDGIGEGVNLYHETGVTTDTVWTGSLLGSLSRPTWFDRPPGDWGHWNNSRGYEARLWGILKWNFTNA